MWFVRSVRFEWWSHACLFFTLAQVFIMKKKLNHVPAKRKSVKISEDKEPESTDNNPAYAASLDEEDQGFGGWLKSSDGLDTMKLFVIANSIVMLTTIVYPHIQNVFVILSDMFYGDNVFE